MAVKLSGTRRWYGVAKHLRKKDGISVNTMKTYSANNKTRKSTAAASSSSTATASSTSLRAPKSKHLSSTDIAEFLIANNLRTVNELMAIAKEVRGW